MLLELNVKDIALIRMASVSFDKGLNILTGETGTGKSVIIDSALLALGGRVRGDMLRRGAEYAYIELLFDVDPEKKELLKELDIFPDENGQLIISRKVMPGRSVSRINDETVTLGKLREVTSLLIDIYGQNEFHTLMDRRMHLAILDDYMSSETSALRESVREAFIRWQQAVRAAAGFGLDEKERLREADLAGYEVREISEAQLKAGEEEELAARYRKLNNARSILESVSGAYRELSACDTGRAISELGHAMRYDQDLKQIYDEMMDIQSMLDSALQDLSAYAGSVEADGSELEETERRLDLIRSLEAKYGRDIPEVLAYKAEREQRLKELENYEQDRQKAEAAQRAAHDKLAALCEELTDARKQGAVRLCDAILTELKDLGFEKARLAMDFQPKPLSADGADDVGFVASLNPGEAMKNLSEVASGGELSRVMLAVKTVLAQTDRIPTLIFDEIDTGISGRTAQKVSEKLDVIGRKHQVICVSHLPQIAAMADTHYVIRKIETDGRNETQIERLDMEGAELELARLLGGAEITKAVRENAHEMKELALKGKAQRRNAG